MKRGTIPTNLAALGAAFVLTTSSQAAPQTFPEPLVGSWCGTESVGTRVDIKANELEEGDGLCTPLGTKIEKGEGVVIYRMKLNCDPGVEGRKSKATDERYSSFAIAGSKFIIREGGLYARDQRVLYGRCKD